MAKKNVEEVEEVAEVDEDLVSKGKMRSDGKLLPIKNETIYVCPVDSVRKRAEVTEIRGHSVVCSDCGSHGMVTGKILCPSCGKTHEVVISSW